MSGHSKWATIKRKKGALDAARGKVFTKVIKEITVAARIGGGNADGNPRLRLALDKAKAANMPKDTIERAVARGSGSKDGDTLDEITYEGYAPGGVAVLVSVLTDNRNRTAPDVRHAFDRAGGSLSAPGSVSFLFELRGVFAVERAGRGEDELTEVALETGCDDVELEDEVAVFYAPPNDFAGVKRELEGRGLKFLSAELSYEPSNRVKVASQEDAKRVLRLIETLEDNDDVQNVYANYDIPEEWLA